MISSATIFGAALPVFLVMALGVLLRRRGVLPTSLDDGLIALTINVAYPAFILRKLIGNEALRDPAHLIWPALCGVGFVAIGLGLGWLAASAIGLRKGTGRRTFALAVSIQNYGYLPIPIMEVLWPDGHWAGLLFVYSLGIELALWSLGLMMLSGSATAGLRRVLNPVTGAIIVGSLITLTGLDAWVPFWARKTCELLGSGSIALGLLLVGTTLGDLLKQPGWWGGWATVGTGLVMRLAFLPALMLLTMLWLPSTPGLREVIAIQAAMPAAVFPLIMARRYGGHEATAMRVIVLTTLVSLFTIPAAVKFALSLMAH
jgi:malate permease and related proteins